MPKINVYLTFKDNCEEAFNFYKSVFGGEFAYLGRFKDMPPTDGKAMNAEQGNRIMHVSLPISQETILMGSDSSDEFGQATVIGNNFSISISADNKGQADTLFKKLSEGGNPFMPMSETFWGSYFGMLNDKFGINWMVSYDQQPVEEKVKQSKTAAVQN
jgi:PhnB protein